MKIIHATQKTQRQTHGPTGLCELFLLTVPIEEVYSTLPNKALLILLFPLYLQTITIAFDVVKWRGCYWCSTARHFLLHVFVLPFCSIYVSFFSTHFFFLFHIIACVLSGLHRQKWLSQTVKHWRPKCGMFLENMGMLAVTLTVNERQFQSWARRNGRFRYT